LVISSESELRIDHGSSSSKRLDVGAHVPQVRPHVHRRDLNLYFMISSRPLLELAREDLLLFDSIDGCKTVAKLEEMFPGTGDRLLRWREAAILELIPPITSPPAPHLVVIEPHMDDAALSAGGSLLNRRGRCRITILSVVKWSNFTSYLLLKRNYLNVREITALRQQESVLVARMLGAEHRCLDWTDAPLRFFPSERWSPATIEEFNKAPQDFAKGFPNSKDVSLLAEQLMRELTILRPDELWIPMGLGDHLDHGTTRSACLMALVEARERFKSVPVLMYEDLPYSGEPGHAALIRMTFASCGTRLVRATEDITDVFAEKLRLSSIYASQFKVSYLEPMLGGFARREGGADGRLAEVFHRMEGERCIPIESNLSRDRAGLVALGSGLRSLLQKRKKCRRLRVMALPTGHLRDWKTDSELLVSAFPNTDLCVYAPADMAWQAQEGGNEKLRVEIVHGGWAGWLKVIRHELFCFGTPTVVMWRGAYSSTPPMRVLKKLINVFIRSLLPFRQVLFTRRLCDFCCVLQEQVQHGLSTKSSVSRL
jgi:LmbE family N-acetylglucosaminyl deacetylase